MTASHRPWRPSSSASPECIWYRSTWSVRSARSDASSWATTWSASSARCEPRLVTGRRGAGPRGGTGGRTWRPLPSRLAVDGAADERLGQVVAVALGDVEQVHAQLPSPSQQLVDFAGSGRAHGVAGGSCRVPTTGAASRRGRVARYHS